MQPLHFCGSSLFDEQLKHTYRSILQEQLLKKQAEMIKLSREIVNLQTKINKL